MANLVMKDDGRFWFMFDGSAVPVAEFRLDYLYQMRRVVLWPGGSAQAHLLALRLAASHARQFVRDREIPCMGGLMVQTRRNSSLSQEDSLRLFNFAKIPSAIMAMDKATIMDGLRQFGIDIIAAAHRDAAEAIAAATKQVGIDFSCSLILREIFDVISDGDIKVSFRVQKPHRFTFYNDVGMPFKGGAGLHIIPAYHPVLNGYERAGLVNGATDFYIRGTSVKRIYCPRAAMSFRNSRLAFGSWGNVRHPFCAIGRSVVLQLDTLALRSAEGVKELAGVLRAALGLDKRYMGISGGFRAPLQSAYSRLRSKFGTESSRPKGCEEGWSPRGSEEHCVWTYLVLEREGSLKGSYIPSWFKKEEWPAIYEGAKI